MGSISLHDIGNMNITHKIGARAGHSKHKDSDAMDTIMLYLWWPCVEAEAGTHLPFLGGRAAW